MTPERIIVIQDLLRVQMWTGLSGSTQHAIAEELLVALADANEKIRNEAAKIADFVRWVENARQSQIDPNGNFQSERDEGWHDAYADVLGMLEITGLIDSKEST